MLSHRIGSRITGPLALAGYLLAAVASPLLHDHAHSHDEFGRCVAAVGFAGGCNRSHRHHHHHAGQHSHHHGRACDSESSESADHHHHGPVPLHDDDCAACQFLAQKPLIAAVAVVVASGELIADFTPTFEAAPSIDPEGAPQPRGPPSLA